MPWGVGDSCRVGGPGAADTVCRGGKESLADGRAVASCRGTVAAGVPASWWTRGCRLAGRAMGRSTGSSRARRPEWATNVLRKTRRSN